MEQSYKEKYEQAIERLKQWDREHPCGGYVLSDRDNFIFPELKESWDEKMRKAIKEALSSKQAEDIIESKYKIKMVDVSDWLEKQGQVKESAISQHENRTCEENDDSLTSEDERIREALVEMVHDTTDDGLWVCYNVHKEEALAWLENQGEREKDILEDAILDGYILDDDEDSLIAETIRYKNEKQGGQKPAWGEAGEINKEILNAAILFTMNSTDEFACNGVSKEDVIDWLKSIKGRVQPQNRWKPSELQLGCLSDAIEHYNSLGYPASKLKELLNDLKKLKEGKV